MQLALSLKDALMEHAWPPQLSPDQEAHLLTIATDYALAHGLVYRPPGVDSQPPSTTSVIHAPYALFPSPFPKELYTEALELQSLYNELYARVTLDDQFLDEVVGGAVAKVDEFQGKLYEAWKTVQEEGIKQPLHLGLFRSDYLLHADPSAPNEPATLKQVEFNTISSSFGSLSSTVTGLHRYLQTSGTYPALSELKSPEAIPTNESLAGLAAGLAAGHKAYGKPEAKILMVIQDDERNAFDQLALTYELQDKHNLTILRLPFSTLIPHLSLSPSSALILTHPSLPTPTEISVLYFRATYTPTDFPSPASWDLRLLIERSTAIKCPTLALQLAGAKKVQQVLAEPGKLERFFPAPEDSPKVEKLRKSFTRLYPLDQSPLGEEALKLARARPEGFVLKPQREGGGNNVYRTDIPPYLDALAEKDKSNAPGAPLHREGYILMDLICPPPAHSIMVRAGTGAALRAETVSELGIYGVALFGKAEGIRVNETVGHLLRTKGKESDEGGVAVGFSVIDSPLMV